MECVSVKQGGWEGIAQHVHCLLMQNCNVNLKKKYAHPKINI